MPQRARGQLGRWSLIASALIKTARKVRHRLTSVPEREWEVDEGLLAEGFSRAVILLDDVVDLADGGRDESEERQRFANIPEMQR